MTVSQLKSFHSFCSQSKRPPPESHRDRVGLDQGALLLARAVLAAAALPLLGAAVRHAACARGRRADVLAAVQRVTYGVAAAAATYFIMLIPVRRSPLWGNCATRRRMCSEATRCTCG